MDFEELEKVEITGGEVFSCCQNREKLKSESNSKLHKFLKGVISLNAEWNEKQKEILQEEKEADEEAQRRFLRSQSRNEIFGYGMRQIVGGFGGSAVIVAPVEKKRNQVDDGMTDEERAVQFKREFNSLRQKAWYSDLSVSGIIDSNRFKNDVDKFTKAYYPNINIASGGEEIDELSSVPKEGYGIEEKLNRLIERILSDDFSKPKKSKETEAKKAPKPLKVKYSKPSGKPFVPEKIDESAIWGSSLDFKGRALPSDFKNEKVNMQAFTEHKENAVEKFGKAGPLSGDESEEKGVAVTTDLPQKSGSAKPKRPKRPQKFKYTKPSGKPFVPEKIDESAIWGESLFGSAFNDISDTFSEYKVEIVLPPKENQSDDYALSVDSKDNVGVAKDSATESGDAVKIDIAVSGEDENLKDGLLKGEIKSDKEVKKDKRSGKSSETAAKPRSIDDLPQNDVQDSGTAVLDGVKDKSFNKQSGLRKKKNKPKRKTAEIIHISREEAARKYTLPKGKHKDFDLDESAIWGGQSIRREFNINSVLSGTFQPDSISENDKKSDKDKNLP